MENKKDIFNGKIKPQYRGYIISSLFIELFVFIGVGVLLFFFAPKVVDFNTKIMTLILAGIFILIGFLFPATSIFIIRKYPKYKGLRKFVLNSDYYFVGENEKIHRGNNFGHIFRENKIAFNLTTKITDENTNTNSKEYPRKYKVYFALLLIGIFFMFFNIVIFILCASKILLDSQIAICFFGFIVVEIVIVISLFILAFKIKKIRDTNK